jgi:transcriptional regulator with XRE-family HTH domain
MKAGLGLRELAGKCQVSPANLHKIEAGTIKEPSPHSLQRIAQHLGCDYEDLAAMAGYSLPEGLPGLEVYLRTKYEELSTEEIRQVEQYVRFVRQGHTQEGIDDGQPAR